MLIVNNGMSVNIDEVDFFEISSYMDKYNIKFYLKNVKVELGEFETEEKAEKVFKDIINYYNSGKKVYIMEG